MHPRILFVLLAAALASYGAVSHAQESVSSESRNAATAYVGTMNFIVGRLGRDCLSLLGRTESPQQFVGAWQSRNAKYVTAAAQYMEAQLAEVQASGGIEKRDTLLRGITTIVRGNGEAAIRGWFERGPREEVCKRMVGFIEAGDLDITPTSPMYGEIEALASWAQK